MRDSCSPAIQPGRCRRWRVRDFILGHRELDRDHFARGHTLPLRIRRPRRRACAVSTRRTLPAKWLLCRAIGAQLAYGDGVGKIPADEQQDIAIEGRYFHVEHLVSGERSRLRTRGHVFRDDAAPAVVQATRA